MCNVGRYRDLSDVGQSGRQDRSGKITMNKKEVVDREAQEMGPRYMSAIFLLGQTCRM